MESPTISIERALIANTTGYVVPLQCSWRSINNWKMIWQESSPDEIGVKTVGAAIADDYSDSFLRSDSDGRPLIGVGLKNVVAVATGDAVYVADMNHANSASLVVEELRAHQLNQAEKFSRCLRPWGLYETLVSAKGFQVKEIMVKSGGVHSLQSHNYRSEQWTVVSGIAEVTVGDDVKTLYENESVYIPLGAIHRLANPHEEDMHLIEVQCGSYLGEGDIVRYEDIYARA